MRLLFQIIPTSPCSSGQPRRDLQDAHGIFCGLVRNACEPRKRRRVDPRVVDCSTSPSNDPTETE